MTHEQDTPVTEEVKSTPPNRWAGDGEVDPHAGHYDKERANLCLGQYTDDEIANGAFMNYDRKLDLTQLLGGNKNYHSPIVWMTGVKDRIRWLSRSLTKAHEDNLALRQRLAKYEPVE